MAKVKTLNPKLGIAEVMGMQTPKGLSKKLISTGRIWKQS